MRISTLEEQRNEAYEQEEAMNTANIKAMEVEVSGDEQRNRVADETVAMNIPEQMSSSTATLKPPVSAEADTATKSQTPDFPVSKYVDPTPGTPMSSQSPSRSASDAASKHRYVSQSIERSPTRSDMDFGDDVPPVDQGADNHIQSRSEIQNIMDQFSEEGHAAGQDEIMSPRLVVGGPFLSNSVQHPPRKSSLDPLRQPGLNVNQGMQDLRIAPDAPTNHQVQGENDHAFASSKMDEGGQSNSSLPLSPPSLFRPPPPEPEPEPDLPFDFHRFLEQLRHRTADPVAKFLRSFLQEFGKKQWMVHEQVKIIGDFLAFITNKMAQCEVWREVSDAEFDNAREGMEKLVMNRLYTQTFSPAIPSPQPIPGSRPKRKGGERPMGPGRRGQHQEDVERDEVLAQKVSIYGWVREGHLDIPPVSDSGKKFLILAQQELLKIKTYRAPRDKIICVLNCCKVIFGLLRHNKTDSSADSFMPLLIYVVLQGNPEHLVSNVQYIMRFRNQEKLGGEAGYYLSSLLGAVQFIENLDRTNLTISDEEFEQHVEAAVSAIAEKYRAETAQNSAPAPLSEKSTLSRPEVTRRHSMEGESSKPRTSTSSNEESGNVSDEKDAMSGLLRTIQKPLTSIGRIFSEELQTGPAKTPQLGNSPRLTPSPRPAPGGIPNPQVASAREKMSAEDAAARQASAEAAEAHRIQQDEHANVVETLAGMFPDLDREIISDVVTQKEGRVGLAVDACLALSS